jgi:hypothetical protein
MAIYHLSMKPVCNDKAREVALEPPVYRLPNKPSLSSGGCLMLGREHRPDIGSRYRARRISFQCVIGRPYLLMKPALDGAIARQQRS